MARIIAITSESAWLVEQGDMSARVMDRASFGHHMPKDIHYEGPVIAGPDGPVVRVGSRLVFEGVSAPHFGSFGTSGDDTRALGRDNVVTSGVIRRIVNFTDVPEPEPVTDESGSVSVRLNPGWGWLIPFVEGGLNIRVEARKAFNAADLLVALVGMGRVTKEDLSAAQARIDNGHL